MIAAVLLVPATAGAMWVHDHDGHGSHAHHIGLFGRHGPHDHDHDDHVHDHAAPMAAEAGRSTRNSRCTCGVHHKHEQPHDTHPGPTPGEPPAETPESAGKLMLTGWTALARGLRVVQPLLEEADALPSVAPLDPQVGLSAFAFAEHAVFRRRTPPPDVSAAGAVGEVCLHTIVLLI